MSQTSAVSPALRQQIVDIVSAPAGIKVSNAAIEYRTKFLYSLRKIQEATQKLTKEGVLTKTMQFGITYYSLTPAAATNTVATSATVGI